MSGPGLSRVGCTQRRTMQLDAGTKLAGIFFLLSRCQWSGGAYIIINVVHNYKCSNEHKSLSFSLHCFSNKKPHSYKPQKPQR